MTEGVLPEGASTSILDDAKKQTQGVSFEAFLNQKMFGSLDGLRFLCICAVVWHHYPLPAMLDLIPGAKQGFLGVDLFFIISGFLIVSLLIRERGRTGGIHLKQFYLRRSFRIFPLYYGVLALLALKAVAKGASSPTSQQYFEDLPILLLYLANWLPGHGTFAIAWSLAAEEQFYLVWPPLEKYFQRWVFPALIGLALSSLIISLHWVDPLLDAVFGWKSSEPAMLRETTFLPILLGVALAHLLHHRRSFEKLEAFFGHQLAAPALLLLLVVQVNALRGDISGWQRHSVHVVMVALLASCVIREDNGLATLLKIKVVARIGMLSYGIYLLHHLGMDLGFKIAGVVGLNHPVIRIVFGVSTLYAIAELSYRFYEKRFIAVRAKYRP